MVSSRSGNGIIIRLMDRLVLRLWRPCGHPDWWAQMGPINRDGSALGIQALAASATHAGHSVAHFADNCGPNLAVCYRCDVIGCQPIIYYSIMIGDDPG